MSIARRDFLMSSAVMAFCGASHGSESKIKPCPLGFGTYGLPGYSIADSIRLVANTGFDSIEFVSMPGYHAAPDRVSKTDRRDVRSQLSSSGLRLGALMGLPHPSPAGERKDTAWVEQMLQLAIDLQPASPPLIQSVLGGGQWNEKRNLFRDTLGPWVEMALQAGVRLAIKPHRGHAMSLPDHGIWLIEQLGRPKSLRLVYDHSHFVYRDLPVAATVAKALPFTEYLVMKDAVMLDGKVRFALPGEIGSIPHTEILKQFVAAGYAGEVCCEVSSQVWKESGYDAVKATKSCFEHLKQIANGLDDSEYVSIFNGNNFEGWDLKDGAWEVHNGEIHCTGKSREKNWLIWRENQPKDFILRLEFRWDKGNSGVQVRSDDLGDYQVFGYQAEIAQRDAMGLWHHSLLAKDHPKKQERHRLADAGQTVRIETDGAKSVTQIQDAVAVQSNYREHDWNRMEIVARDDLLIQKINGVVFATLSDRDAQMSRRSGFIALQDHGKGCRVAFRNLQIKPL